MVPCSQVLKKLNKFVNPVPSTTLIGRKSRATISAIRQVILLTRCGEQSFLLMNEPSTVWLGAVTVAASTLVMTR